MDSSLSRQLSEAVVGAFPTVLKDPGLAGELADELVALVAVLCVNFAPLSTKQKIEVGRELREDITDAIEKRLKPLLARN